MKNLDTKKDIVIEGAALLPTNVKSVGISKDNYICIVPTEKFQLEKYLEREWVSHYLSESKDKNLAFNNWMKRDIEFAKLALEDALKLQYSTILVDGKKSIESNYKFTKYCFGLIKGSL